MVAFALMFYFVISAILQYYAYPTQTKVEVRLDRTMIFPAVTVCSGNSYRYDKINASLVSFFNRLMSPNATFDQNLLNSLVIPLVVDLFSRNQTEELVSVGFQLSDMLLSCTYNGLNCADVFTQSISAALGNCFTFNWKTSTKLFTISDFGEDIVLKEGLSMTFYIPQELFFPSSWFDAGLIILLHDNDELPMPNENGLYLQPARSHLITYRKSETTFLPSPYTNCTSNVRDDLHALYKTTFLDSTMSTKIAYSETLCLELCEQAYIFSQCSCILPMPFFARNVFTLDDQLISANFCNIFTSQLSCTVSAKQQLLASSDLQRLWCTHCVPQCLHTYFKSDLSAQSGPSVGESEQWHELLVTQNYTGKVLLPNDFAQRFDYYFNRNYLKILVSCGSKYVTEYKQEPKLTIIDTFSAIGGQTGL
ncbi:unnamed protein product [Rotaria sp. Silwood2]|nr:unnamed protein product [Rotaria sp. Silwood2]